MAGSLLFLLAPFLGRMRFSSTAVRVQLFLLGVALLLWSGVGWMSFFAAPTGSPHKYSSTT